MSLILDKWEQWECRTEAGIFFPNDEYIALSFDADGVCLVSARQSIQNLIDEGPEGWANIDSSCEFSNDEYIVMGGYGSWEGEGWVALFKKPNRSMKWLLHLVDSEAITELSLEDKFIKAVAAYYPRSSILKIPIGKPETLSIVRQDLTGEPI